MNPSDVLLATVVPMQQQLAKLSAELAVAKFGKRGKIKDAIKKLNKAIREAGNQVQSLSKFDSVNRQTEKGLVKGNQIKDIGVALGTTLSGVADVLGATKLDDVSEVVERESTNKMFIYIGGGLLALIVLIFMLKKK